VYIFHFTLDSGFNFGTGVREDLESSFTLDSNDGVCGGVCGLAMTSSRAADKGDDVVAGGSVASGPATSGPAASIDPDDPANDGDPDAALEADAEERGWGDTLVSMPLVFPELVGLIL